MEARGLMETTVHFKMPKDLILSPRAYELIITALVEYRQMLLDEAMDPGCDDERQIDIRIDRTDISTLLGKLCG
jgi:hypothetical protein